MTQDEKWNQRYQEVANFIETNHRNPSRHRIEEHDFLNWLKANRKALNSCKMKQERMEKKTSGNDGTVSEKKSMGVMAAILSQHT